MKISLNDESGAAADREPIELDGLQRWGVRQAVLQECLEGRGVEQVIRVMRAKGELPLGHAGLVCVQKQQDLARLMIGQLGLAPQPGDGRIEADPAVPIDLRLAGIRLTGSVTSLYGGMLREAQFGGYEGRKLIEPWISLLAVRATLPGARRLVVVLGEEKGGEAKICTIGLEAPDNARSLLEDLVRVYLLGIREPVPLPPRASWEFARVLQKVTTDPAFFDAGLPSDEAKLEAIDKACIAAGKKWRSTDHGRGDDADPYIARLFEKGAPLVDARTKRVSLPFARLSLRVWGPLLRAECDSREAAKWAAGGAR